MRIKITDFDLDTASPRELIDLIDKLDSHKELVFHHLEARQKACEHEWGEAEEHRKHTKGFHIPPRRMGSDYDPGVDIPPKTEVSWSRTCKRCCLIQKTDKQKEIATPSTYEPDFGG